MKRIVVILSILLSSSVIAGEPPRSPVCWPLNYAGITLGVNTDSEVQRLLGNGVARKEIGSAERYFIDPKRTATLHIVSLTDYIVAEVTVQEGVAVKPAEVDSAITPWFDPLQGFGKWHKLHLGSTKDEVKSNLGEPVKGSTADAWRYDTRCACEIEKFFTIYFKDDRIFKVVFSAPHG
jgi:hypothetical protein